MVRGTITSGRRQRIKRAHKTLRNVVLSAGTVLALLLLAGMVYTWEADQRDVIPMSSLSLPSSTQSGTPITAVQPAANAKEGAAVTSVTTPITPGSAATLIIQTNPGSICTVVVAYKGVTVADPNLSQKSADVYGSVSWNWMVGQSVPVGTWPATVTCAYHGQTGVVQAQLQISKP